MKQTSVSRRRRTSSSVAPPVPKPVLVFTNSAPARTAAAVASRFCPPNRKHVRVGTFSTAPQAFCRREEAAPRLRRAACVFSLFDKRIYAFRVKKLIYHTNLISAFIFPINNSG